MIDLNQPPVHAAGLTLFADDQRPPVWHFVPERPAIEMLPDGHPAFLLIKYRVNLSRRDWPRGGGLLRLQCGLRPSSQALAEARTVLIAQSSGALQNIVPLQPERVTCELLLGPVDSAGQSAVQATPSSQPPFDASFHVPLSIDGVTLFEQALKSGLSPAAVRYQLVVKGRGPQLPAKVTIDWRRISETRTERATTSVQEHIERGDIRVEITQAGGDSTVMERVVDEISHILKTRLPAPEGRTTALFDLTQAREEERVMVVSATIAQLLAPLGPSVRPESLITTMEESHKPERRISIQAVGGFQDGEVSAIEGSATIGDRRHDFVLNEKNREAAFDIAQPAGGAGPIQFRYRVFLRQNLPYAQQSSFESPVISSEASIFLIDPRQVYKPIAVRAFATFDPERYRHALVDVKAEATGGWSHTETLRIGPDVQDAEARFIVDAAAEVTLRRRYRYVTRAGDVVEQAWEPADEGMMAVGNPPAAGSRIA